uniref:Uncharacterized protein n=1 Tax=Tetradesmus obliquus TaxID=3088 RepID=A0A383VI57_TETOB|eukprot:jgi/Sobl393_1/19996/SZX64620.1
MTQAEIMKEVMHGLCRPIGGPALRSLIDAHFDDNVVLKNPLFAVKGKEQLYHLFHAWSGLLDDTVQVLDVAAHGNIVLLKVRHNLLLRPLHMAKHALPAVATQLLTVPLIVNAEVETVQTAAGTRITSWVDDISVYSLILNLVWPTKHWLTEVETVQTAAGTRITSWVDDISVYSLIFNIVWPSKLFNFWDVVEGALGQGIVAADKAVSSGYRILQPLLAPHAEAALRSADTLLKQRLGWDAGLSSAASKFWA